MSVVLSWMIPAIAAAEAAPAVCMAPLIPIEEEPSIRVGADTDRVWLESTIDGLRVRKFTQKGGASVLELQHGRESVVISVSPGRLSVLRNGTTATVDPADPQSIEAIQSLLAASRAVLQARRVFSRLERRSSLKGPQMSLVTSLAFVASLLGDVEAPSRLSDRFGGLHAGRVRPVRLGASCWTNYTTEVMAAQDDLAHCLVEAAEGSVFLRSFRETGCEITWILRVESAWFELIKCSGVPLAAG